MKRRVQKNFDFYSIRDAATYLDVSTGTIHDYVRAGFIEHLRASNCAVLFTREALDKFKKTDAERRATLAKLSIRGAVKASRTGSKA